MRQNRLTLFVHTFLMTFLAERHPLVWVAEHYVTGLIPSSLLCRERVQSFPSGNIFKNLQMALPHACVKMNSSLYNVNWRKQFAKPYIQIEPTHFF